MPRNQFTPGLVFTTLVLLGMLAALLVLMVRSDFLFTASAQVSEMIRPEPVTVLFVGDIMLDRQVAFHIKRVGSEAFLQNIVPLFEVADINVGNLEGTVTHNPSIAQVDTSIFRFTFEPVLAEKVLQTLGLTIVSLANNHTLDFGIGGYKETRDFLTARDVMYFGSPSNSENLSVVKTVRGKVMCFIGYQDFVAPDPSKITKEIEILRPACYRIIVFPHWGEEYAQVETERQRILAHAFIDAGADLVIGAHPHVVEPLEVYKDKAIFYSLGNFIFDQYFSALTRRGLAVEVEFSDNETRFTMTPVRIEREGITPLTEEKESFTILQKP